MSSQTQTNVAIETMKKISEGEVPSNQDLRQVMDTTKDFLRDQKDAPPEAQRVFRNAAELVEATETILEHKNREEEIQKLAVHGTQAIKNVAETGKEQMKELSPKKGEVGQKAQEAGKAATRAGQAALNVVKMMLTSGEFRSWFLDFSTFLHDALFQSYQQQAKQPTMGGCSKCPPGQCICPAGKCQCPPGCSCCTKSETFTTTTSVGGETKTWYHGMTKEQIKQKLSQRLMLLLRRLNASSDFKTGARDFMDALDELKEQAKKVGSDFKQRITDDEEVQMALDQARSLVENFSGRKLDQLLDALDRFAKDLSNDDNLDRWLNDARALFDEALLHPDKIDEQVFVRRVEDLIDRADEIREDIKNKQDWSVVADETKAIFENIKNDPDVKLFNEKAKNFFQSFTYIDEKGNRRINTDLVSQMTHYVVPLLLKHLEEIPIPPIESHNEDYDYKIENLSVAGQEIIPEHVQFFMASEFDFNLRKLETEKGHTSALLKISNMKTKLSGIQFWVKKKSFPSLEDRGTADVKIGGKGATLKIYLQVENIFGERPTFLFSRVKFNVDSLSIHIVKTQHTIVTPLVAGLWNAKIKHTIEEEVEKKIVGMGKTLEGAFNDVVAKYPPSRLASMATEKLQTVVDKAQEGIQTVKEKLTTTQESAKPSTTSA